MSEGTIDGRSFQEKLRDLINFESRENGSDTPDFILAQYLMSCLLTFDKTVRDRDRWYRAEGKQVPER